MVSVTYKVNLWAVPGEILPVQLGAFPLMFLVAALAGSFSAVRLRWIVMGCVSPGLLGWGWEFGKTSDWLEYGLMFLPALITVVAAGAYTGRRVQKWQARAA